jgi:hypothetical protein
VKDFTTTYFRNNFVLSIILFLLLLSGNRWSAQTIIINPANAAGTSLANGSFENVTNTFPANGWTVVNSGVNSKWFVGTFTKCSGSKGAYIGTASGNNNYTMGTAAVSHFYVNVTFPAGQTCILLSFNWKSEGENGYDGFKVSLGSTGVAPVANALYTTTDGSAVALGRPFYNLQTSCGNVTITIPTSFAGTTKRLVFSWVNDNSGGTNPGATIDDISLISQASVAPVCATALVPANTATGISPCNSLTWTAPASSGCNTATSYDVYFGTSATPPFLANSTTTSYQLAMNFNTTYYWQIRPKNGTGTATGCAIQSFTTGAASNPNYNLVGDATSAIPYDCVTLTPNAVTMRGCSWDANSTVNFAADFSYEIDVNLGSSDAGADGMAMVIHNDPLGRCVCGTAGSNMGAGGIQNSVIVEIDTYMSYEDRDDFTAPLIGCAGTEDVDHLDIWFDGDINPSLDANCDAVAVGERPANPFAVRLQNPPGTNYNIENGLSHKFRIAWNAGTTTLTASILNSSLTITYGTVSTSFNPAIVFGTNTPFIGFTASTGGFSNQQSFCLPASLLPVGLIDFEGSCKDGTTILSWVTATEENNAYFTVEKSCDGIQYEILGDVPGAINSTTTLNYSLRDENPCNHMAYYRLGQTDLNGNKHVLKYISVLCESGDQTLIYPNPTRDELNIHCVDCLIEQAVLYNGLGQQISSFPAQDFEYNQNKQLSLKGFAPGLYYLKLLRENRTEIHKIVVE